MVKIVGIGFIVLASVIAYFSHNFIFPLILSIMGSYLLFIYQIGASTFEFTRLITKYPNEAYDWFKQNKHCWKIYEGQLPNNYINEIPSNKMKPLRVFVPKIGNQKIYIFGKYPECRESEKEFIKYISGAKTNYTMAATERKGEI